MPVIPALEDLRQEDGEFEAILGCINATVLFTLSFHVLNLYITHGSASKFSALSHP